jgi:hypothetical protein
MPPVRPSLQLLTYSSFVSFCSYCTTEYHSPSLHATGRAKKERKRNRRVAGNQRMTMLITKHLVRYHPHAWYPSVRPSARVVVVPIRSARLLTAPQTSMANAELADCLLCVLLGWVRTCSQSTCVLERANVEQWPGVQMVSYYAVLAVRLPVWLVPRVPASMQTSHTSECTGSLVCDDSRGHG